jgi:hypothetical protein
MYSPSLLRCSAGVDSAMVQGQLSTLDSTDGAALKTCPFSDLPLSPSLTQVKIVFCVFVSI